ncbi:MAG: type 4a pilus biogenesis protein PilO [bacterium]
MSMPKITLSKREMLYTEIASGLIILFFVVPMVFGPLTKNTADAKIEIDKVSKEAADTERKINELNSISNIQVNPDVIAPRIPESQELPAVLNRLALEGRRHNLSLSSIQPVGIEKDSPKATEMRINLTLEGRYSSLYNFFVALRKTGDFLVVVKDIDILRSSEPMTVTAKAVVAVFYLN